MTRKKYPGVGEVDAIPERFQPQKVWKHLYSPAEHWERLTVHDILGMRAEAEQLSGQERGLLVHKELPHFSNKKQWLQIKRLLCKHHDETYRAIYMTELASDATRWSKSPNSKFRMKVLTPRSIFIVVALCRDNSYILTAFRPLYGMKGVSLTEDDIADAAKIYFQKDTGMNDDTYTQLTAQSLRQTSATSPESLTQLWRLSSAVGYGRALAEQDKFRTLLQKAEHLLAQVDPELVEAFIDALDWEGALSQIAAGLKDESSEDLEYALSRSEDILAAATAVGAAHEASVFLKEASELLAWLPSEWGHIMNAAAQKASVFAASESSIFELWESVEEAGLAAIIREQEPTHRPEARYLDMLIPPESELERLSDKIKAVSANLTNTLFDWAKRSLDNISLQELAPAMGGSDPLQEEWKVKGTPAVDAPYFRLFIAEEDTKPQEVTEAFNSQDGELWWMDQQSLVILFASKSLLPKDIDFEELLELAESRGDIISVVKELNPPN